MELAVAYKKTQVNFGAPCDTFLYYTAPMNKIHSTPFGWTPEYFL